MATSITSTARTYTAKEKKEEYERLKKLKKELNDNAAFSSELNNSFMSKSTFYR